jgi:peptidoglycan hydrolase CwlO-like protein
MNANELAGMIKWALGIMVTVIIILSGAVFAKTSQMDAHYNAKHNELKVEMTKIHTQFDYICEELKEIKKEIRDGKDRD